MTGCEYKQDELKSTHVGGSGRRLGANAACSFGQHAFFLHWLSLCEACSLLAKLQPWLGKPFKKKNSFFADSKIKPARTGAVASLVRSLL